MSQNKKLENLPVWRCSEEALCGEQWASFEEQLNCPFCHCGIGQKTDFTYEQIKEAADRFGFKENLPVHLPIPIPEVIQLSTLPQENWIGLLFFIL